MGESERLREALINLERARDREQELHLESEGLLTGLQVLVTSQTTAEMFSELLEVFRTVLSFEEAFVLTARADETMKPVASTAVKFADSVWRPQVLFKRVIESQPTAVFDVEQVREWQDQPERVRAAAKSALHIPLRGGPRPVMLICTHTERGYFGHKHVKLGQRFAPLAAQALLHIELQRAIVERDRLFTLSFDLMCIVGFDGRFKQLNPAWEKALGWAMDELEAKPLIEYVHPEDRAATSAALQKLMTGAAVSFENRCVCRDGSSKWLLWSATGRTEEQLLYAVARDITERKRVEAQRQASIRFLESLEQVNRATRQASDVEQMLRDVIEAVYSIFDCDRAWLLYPCDPEAPTFRVPVECVRPGYPGAYALDLDIPMKPGADRVCAAALASEDPIVYGPDTDRAVYKELVDQFGVLSQMIIAVYPKVGRTWMFGMHQCSHARVWTVDEQRLFKEISRRVGDALSTLLLLRDLRDSEEKYRKLVNTISDLVYTFDVAGNILFVNPAAKQFTGRGPEETIGHNFTEYVHPDDVPVLLTGFQQALSGAPWESIEGLGQDGAIKHRMVRGDGAVIWVASKGALIKDNQGATVGFTGVSRNITEQVQADKHLRLLKEFNENIVQNMSEGIVVQDAQGYLTFVNPTAAALLGYAPAEMMGLHWTTLIPPDQHPIVMAADERRVRGEADRYELELVCRDGRRVPVLVSGRPRFEEGRFAGTLAVFTDITERKRAEEGQRKALAEALQATHALRESEARLRVLIDHLPAEVWAMDNNLYFIIQNAASARIIGNVVGKRIEDLDVPTGVKAGWLEQDRQVLDGNIICEEYQIKVEGEQKAYENIVAPVKVGDTIIGLVGVALDVTERKRAAEELEKHRDHLEELIKERTAELVVAKEQAEAANRAKSAFLASMSHELRTPLNAILGYAQIFQRRPLAPEIIDGLHIIQRSGEHLLILINDILTISKIETGRMELYPGLIHFPAFLADIASIVHPRAGTKHLAFNLEQLNTLPTWVQADETRLRQVLLNLLDNAIKFTDEGSVTLRVGSRKYGVRSKGERQPVDPLLPASRSYSLLRFEVQDSGSGIAPDQLERIFQPFEQAEDVTRWIAGPGLGLPISRQLVRLMGGELHVASHPSVPPAELDASSPACGGEVKEGPGSTFWFEVALPVSEEMVEEVQLPGRIITGYQGSRRTVLVVDDVSSNRAVLVELLQPLGFEVIEAADGQQAVHLAQATRPDLILMDRWMPVLDGFEATRWMRQIPELQGVVIIAVSASVAEADQAQSREVGIDAFLPKPVNWPRLAALLEEHLGLEWEVEEGSERDLGELPSAALTGTPGTARPPAPTCPGGRRRGRRGAGGQVGRAAGEALALPHPHTPTPLVPPPQEELALLLDLARMGDMHAIHKRAAHIETLGEQYVPFASKLRELARSFEERQILALVRQYVEESE